MIKDKATLEYIFSLIKQIKKPLVKIYPNGTIIGTDEQFASLNVLIPEVINYNITIPYIFRSTEIAAFMREAQDLNYILYDKYDIDYVTLQHGRIIDHTILTNHMELSFQFDELYNKVISTRNYPELYREENFQNTVPDMFTLRVSDGAKMYSFGVDKQFLMTSFNAIHPANKTDRVELIIRDYDYYSYTAEFIIYKKKDKYQLHEFLRFRKL